MAFEAFRNSGARTRAALVGVFAAIVALAGLWTLPPLDRDESRFAQATAQMLESGDYIAIRFQDRERNKKPAGAYWLQAASVSLFSDVAAREIWAYRIPSVIGVVLAALFTFFAARRLYDPDTAFLAGLLIAAAPVVAAEATIAKTDGVLLALVCLAQWALAEVYAGAQTGAQAEAKAGAQAGWRFPLAFWIAQGAAVLVKGPIAPMISGLAGAALVIADRKPGWLFRLKPVAGVLILLAMVAPWAFAINAATDGRFFAEAVGGDMLGKLGEAQESHAGPPGYHTLLLWVLFWPAAALLAPGLVHLWRDRKTAWQARFLLAWIVPAWLVFELTATKLPHYVMPLYPALAITAAHAVMKDGPGRTRLRRIGALVYGAIGLGAAAAVAILPMTLSAAPQIGLCLVVALLVGAGAVFGFRLFWTGQARAGALFAALLAGAYAWALMGLVLPKLDVLALSPRLSAAFETAGRHPLRNGTGPVALAGYSEPSAVFLIGTDTVLTNGADAGRLLSSGAIAAAGVEAREADAFRAAAGADIAPVAAVDGLNYSNGKQVSITIYVATSSTP